MKRVLVWSAILQVALSIGSVGANENPWVRSMGSREATTGELVVLKGWAQDRDRDKLEFRWVRSHDHAPPAVIQYPANSTAYFVPTEPGVYRFRLYVRDEQGGLGSDATTVYVSSRRYPSHSTVHSLLHHASRQRAWRESVYERLGAKRPSKDGLADYLRERGLE